METLCFSLQSTDYNILPLDRGKKERRVYEKGKKKVKVYSILLLYKKRTRFVLLDNLEKITNLTDTRI